ncbi:hypothetical protein NC653_029719 [Populus alba x Populus x berolinensis]|uniref:Uncharacterized protein n=1 Tax=Populus alba x Populus x berolinensis TaxID=444605 RepID=A0AAD6M2W0_9ROSI|nr:hypothetical protein NC653_029719 [Populus alba x Populus x berolinensis]
MILNGATGMDGPSTSQYQQLNQMTMQNIHTILCIGCTDFGAMTMLVMTSYWPEKQFVVADDNHDVINAWQYQDLPVFEPGLQMLLAQRRNANLRFSNYIGEEINEARIVFVAPDKQTKRNGEGMGGCLDFAKWKEVVRMILNGATRMDGPSTSQYQQLNQGTIITDLRNPTQVTIIARSKNQNSNLIVELYEKWVSLGRIFRNISPQIAMISKMACNVIQVMDIASINYFTLLCDEFGADVTEVEGIISRDRRTNHTEIKHNVGISSPEL